MITPGETTNRDAIIGISPPWNQNENPNAPGAGASKMYSLAAMLDNLREQLRLGVLARYPGAGGCPDALSITGNDRQIDRGLNETDASYAARQSDAFSLWATAGSAWSVIRNLVAMVSPFKAIVRTVTATGIWDSQNDPAAPLNGWATWRIYPTPPGNWNWDGDQLSFWRFWPIIYSAGVAANLWQAAPNYGAANFTWGQYSGSWGLTASPGAIQLIRKVVGKWFRAGSYAPWIIVSLDTTLFPPTATLPNASLPDGNWGHWSKTVANQRVPSRAANARYCDGVQ